MAYSFGIIGGCLKGMKLISPPDKITRPLRAMVKKSLFDRLSGRMESAVCLDLYSGSGSIGLEAISRGARLCTFVESTPAVFSVLKKNMDKVKTRVDNDAVTIRVVRSDVMRILKAGPAPEAPFDIVFLDPPFNAYHDAERCLEYLASDDGWLSDEGIVVYHFSSRTEPSWTGWEVIDQRRYGDSRVAILSHSDEEQ